MLHTLWGKAQGHPDYDKAQWMELQRQFDGLLAACEAARETLGELTAALLADPGHDVGLGAAAELTRRKLVVNVARAKGEAP